jgi:hypothetical protein
MGIKCRACGMESPDDARWCDFCKEPFVRPSPAPRGTSPKEAPPPKEGILEKVWRRARIALLILSLGFAAATLLYPAPVVLFGVVVVLFSLLPWLTADGRDVEELPPGLRAGIRIVVGLILVAASAFLILFGQIAHAFGYIQAHGGATPSMSLAELGRNLLLTSPFWLILFQVSVATFGVRTMLKAAPLIAVAIFLAYLS